MYASDAGYSQAGKRGLDKLIRLGLATCSGLGVLLRDELASKLVARRRRALRSEDRNVFFTAGARLQVAVLCVRAASFTCALPITDVVETMRPLPVKPLHGAPTYVLGLTLARGHPAVVIDAGLLLGGSSAHTEAHRFVSLRRPGQPMILAVEAVLGIRHLDLGLMQPMPRGLGTHPASRALGALDQNLMLSLDVHQLLNDAGLAAMQAI